MARTDNLNNFLTDVAGAIRDKKGTTDEIKASEFDTEIASIETGGGDIDEYFDDEINYSGGNTNAGSNNWSCLVKKLPAINVNNGGSYSNMFYGFKGKEIPKIILNAVPTNMSSMFSNCSNLTSLDLSNFDTSNVTNMSSMFSNCSNLTSLDLSNFDTSNVTNMSAMFMSCKNLKEMPKLNTSKNKEFGNFFRECKEMTIIPELDMSSANSVYSMFYLASGPVTLGGLKNAGKAYLTSSNTNYFNYTLNLQNCINLTHDSLMNVINGLYDIATAGVQPQQLILGSTNLAKLTDEEVMIGTSKGWSIS